MFVKAGLVYSFFFHIWNCHRKLLQDYRERTQSAKLLFSIFRDGEGGSEGQGLKG